MALFKVLSLESWQKIHNNEEEKLKEIKPIFNRDGYYLSKDGLCWFETNGRAFLYEEEEFRFRLNLLNIPSLSLNQLDALKKVVKYKIASKEQIKLLRDIEFLEEQRKMCREISILVCSVKKKKGVS